MAQGHCKGHTFPARELMVVWISQTQRLAQSWCRVDPSTCVDVPIRPEHDPAKQRRTLSHAVPDVPCSLSCVVTQETAG